MDKGFRNTGEFKIAEFIRLDPSLISAAIALFAVLILHIQRAEIGKAKISALVLAFLILPVLL